MKTINDILKIFPWTKAEEWKQHDKGKGWVQITAHVDATATILGLVFGDARVSGSAWVSGDARVYGNARVSGNAWVFGDARVSGNAWVSGDARVSGDAQVFDKARVSGDARVYGDAWVSGDARVSGDAWVFGDARVSGDARVFGNARVSGDAWETSPLYIQGSRHSVTNCAHGSIAIGCQVHTFAEWKAKYKTIGKAAGYTAAQIKEYSHHIAYVIKVGK